MLTELLDRRLHIEANLSQFYVCGFRAQRIRFAVKFLTQKIETAADSDSFRQQITGGADMHMQAIDLLPHVGFPGQQGSLRGQTLLG